MLGTVCRAGDLLELFDLQSPEWGATAVSRRLDITKSQAHEMLVSLESIGLLRRAGQGRFRLGWRMVTFSQRLMRTEFSSEEASILRQLGRHTGAFVDLTTHDGDSFVRIASFGTPEAVGGAEERPSASAKVLLAEMSASQVDRLYPGLDLEVELELVRTRGIAFELEGGPATSAAPVHDHHGNTLAALGLTVSPQAWQAKSALLTKALVGTASRLSDCIRQRRRLAGTDRPEVLTAAVS